MAGLGFQAPQPWQYSLRGASDVRICDQAEEGRVSSWVSFELVDGFGRDVRQAFICMIGKSWDVSNSCWRGCTSTHTFRKTSFWGNR